MFCGFDQPRNCGRYPLLGVLDSLRLVGFRERLIFAILLLGRVLLNFLDLVGLASVGFLSALLALNLSGQESLSFLGVQVSPRETADLFVLVFLIAGLFIVKTSLGAFLLHRTSKFLGKLEASMGAEVIQLLFSGDLKTLKNHTRGEIQWAIGPSVNSAFSVTLYSGSALITEGSLLILIFAFFVYVDGTSALFVAMYFGVIVFGFQSLVARKQKALGKKIASNSVVVNNYVLGITDAFREIAVANRLNYFNEKLTQARTSLAESQAIYRFLVGSPRFIVEAALMLGFVTLISLQFAQGNLSEGVIVTGVFLSGGMRLMAALLPFQNALSDLRLMRPQAERARTVLRELRLEKKSGERPQASDVRGFAGEGPSLPQGNIFFDEVSFSYEDAGPPVIQDLTLEIKEGETVAFVGESGAGKSTIADLMLGLLEPTRGQIRIGGLTPNVFREQAGGAISYLPQSTGLLPGSLTENVSLGQHKDSDQVDRVGSLLEALGLSSVAEKAETSGHDFGLNEQLSGGQLQRLGIARALYTSPQLLVLDEATSALDAETEKAVSEFLYKETRDSTVVIIAHRISTVKQVDRIFVLHGGQIEAAGTYEELLRTSSRFRRVVEILSTALED